MSRNPALADELAVAIAAGSQIKTWARTRNVPVRSAYRWSARPELRARVDRYRETIVTEALHLLAARSAGDLPPRVA